MRVGGTAQILSFALCIVLFGPNTSADTALKAYRNERWNFCLSYPGKWSDDEGIDKAGILLSRGDVEISIGALPNQPAELGQSRPMTIEEIADSSIKAFGVDLLRPAEHMEVVLRKRTALDGLTGLETEVRYVENKVASVQETILVLNDDVVYQFQLRCKQRELVKYLPIFRSVLNSFEWHCRRGTK